MRELTGTKPAEWLRPASGGGDTPESRQGEQGAHDGSVLAPRGAASEGGIAQGYARTALHRDFLELAFCEEPNPLAIGGEEGLPAVLGFGQQGNRGLAEKARRKLLLTARAAGREHDAHAVGRDRHARFTVDYGIGSEVDAQPYQGVIHSPRGAPCEPPSNGCDDRHHCGHSSPGHHAAPPRSGKWHLR